MRQDIVELLTKLKQCGASWQREQKGDAVMDDLRDLLPDDEFCQIAIARSHHKIGESRAELDRLCNQLIEKYRADRPRPSSKRTFL